MIAILLLAAAYPWLASAAPSEALSARIAPPPGFVREEAAPGGFAAWLRGLPLKPGHPPVHLFDGRLKGNQGAHAAVVDIDVGGLDLQQCADAVMRLRAEYLFASGQAQRVSFRFTSGDAAGFFRWAQGERPQVKGSSVRWARTEAPDASHASFRRYLDTVFTFAGSSSLAGELLPKDASTLGAGDVFVHPGFPGHAVLVVDTARDAKTGRRVFLIVQSYMPAQEIQLLRNPGAAHPWYPVDFGGTLVTPEWTFTRDELRRFPPLGETR